MPFYRGALHGLHAGGPDGTPGPHEQAELMQGLEQYRLDTAPTASGSWIVINIQYKHEYADSVDKQMHRYEHTY